MKPELKEYKHEWHIVIKADSPEGAMDAVWQCWKAWGEGSEPLGGCCPASRGDRVDYSVKKIKSS
jgi:hypothetical protein